MNTVNPTYKNKQEGSSKMLFAMVGIGIVCALLIVLTFEYTGPAIEKKAAAAAKKRNK